MTSRQSEIDRNWKLRLERELLVNMRTVFADMSNHSKEYDFSTTIYMPRIASILEKHYLNVADKFSVHYRRRELVAMDKIQEAMLISDLRARIQLQAFNQTRVINHTNGVQFKQVRETILKNRKMLVKQNPNISLDDPNLRSNVYMSLLQKRLPVMACTETQWVAETSKWLEASYLTGEAGVVTKAKSNKFKRWDAVGDDKMRQWHADADSQVKETTEPFIVDGQQLLYPGDMSLGATSHNIINCRCSAFYSLAADTLTGAQFVPETIADNPVGTGGQVLLDVRTKSPKQVAADKAAAIAAKVKKQVLVKAKKAGQDKTAAIANAKNEAKKAKKEATALQVKADKKTAEAKRARKEADAAKKKADKAAAECD